MCMLERLDGFLGRLCAQFEPETKNLKYWDEYLAPQHDAKLDPVFGKGTAPDI